MTDPVKSSPPYLLQVASRLQTARYLASHAITSIHPAETYVIHELGREAPLSQAELSRRLGIGNASVGQTVKRLERGGFVVRCRDRTDRRQIMVRLTRKGCAALGPLEAATTALVAEIHRVLGKERCQAFCESLECLIAHFRRELSLSPKTGQRVIS